MRSRSANVANVVLAAAVAFALAGCSAAGHAPAASALPPTSEPAATLTPVAAPTTALPTASAPIGDTGNVGAAGGPIISVEPLRTLAIRVTLADLDAKAWRVTVAGTGAAAQDRWTLTVETGDVAPAVTTTETLGGVDGEAREQVGLESGARTGRICSVSVPVCLQAATVVLPSDGNGTLVLELTRTDTATSLRVTGATATWPAEPFIVGPWTTTEAFPWEP